MRTSIKGLLTLSLLTFAAPAMADEEADPPSDITVTGGISLVSDYRFRGISFSAEDIAVQGTININHSSGIYLGTWASSLDDTPVYGHTEVDIYAGYATEVAPGTTLDVGLLYYYYPNGDARAAPVLPATVGVALNSDYFEPYASIKTTLGSVTVKLGAAYAWDQVALGSADNIYVFTDLGLGVPNTPISLNAHLGYSDGALALGSNYWDWSLGADWAVGRGLTVGVKYVDSDLNQLTGIPAADTLYDATVLFTIGASF
ncbi:MAG: TorF family putative porin [Sphingopyxis sp.]